MQVSQRAVWISFFFAAAFSLLPVAVVAQTTHDIVMIPQGQAFTFSPSSITIQQGDIVRWTNNTSLVIHTTTSGIICTPSGLWNSGDMLPGAIFSRQFNDAPGTYNFFCIPHCLFGMTGTVTVDNPPTGIGEMPAPPRYQLFQNVPNPFSPETTIEYEIADPARVVIHVHNLKGQRVRTIEDRSRAPGRYPARWDGRNADGSKLATGVYFYQMSLNGVAVEMKKMVLLR